MNIRQGTKDITIGGQKIRAIIEYEFNDYVLYVFPGKLSQFDILIKYKKDGSRIRTPKHIHWVVDILLKMENKKTKTRQFLEKIKQIWENSQPMTNRQYETLCNLIQNGLNAIDITQFEELNSYGEYSIDFLYVLMQLLSTQEKTNRNDAYMFGQIIDELLELDLDIFRILSKAGFGGRRSWKEILKNGLIPLLIALRLTNIIQILILSIKILIKLKLN